MEPNRPPEDWAAVLRQNWEERGRSSARDFFVASHPGWDSPLEWEAQAAADTRLLLHELEDAVLAHVDVLEVGCGVGRLAPHLLQRCRSYTGIDIAPSMVEEARTRLPAALGDRARFFAGDGLSVPAEAQDRRYGLAIAHAVFIHCPRGVIADNVRSAWSLIREGGELRFQLRADPHVPGGYQVSGDEAPGASVDDHSGELPVDPGALVVPREAEDQIATSYYMGHAYTLNEVEQLLEGLALNAIQEDVVRLDPAHFYVRLKKGEV